MGFEIKERATSLYYGVCELLVLNWLQGRVGTDAPTDPEQFELVRKASSCQCGKGKESLINHPKDSILKANQWLMSKRVLTHLQQVATHRNWIRWTYQVLVLCGVQFDEEMKTRVNEHDLSKYSPEEILGYGIMFGEGKGFRKIEDADEQKEWLSALEHHYQNNPHHPEYFYPKKDGVREKVDIHKLPKGKLCLQESVVDMLACRGEREMRDDEAISAEKWMAIPEVFLKRYSDADREFVLETLAEWKMKAMRFAERPDCALDLKGMLNGKPLVV